MTFTPPPIEPRPNVPLSLGELPVEEYSSGVRFGLLKPQESLSYTSHPSSSWQKTVRTPGRPASG